MAETQARTLIRLLNGMNRLYLHQEEASSILEKCTLRNFPKHFKTLLKLFRKSLSLIHVLHELAVRLRLAELESWSLPVEVEDSEELLALDTELK